MYDRATEAWTLLFSVVKTFQQYGACKRMFMRLMWAAFCRFFRQMLIAAKVSGHSRCCCCSVHRRHIAEVL
jgi:hypothetical protein